MISFWYANLFSSDQQRSELRRRLSELQQTLQEEQAMLIIQQGCSDLKKLVRFRIGIVIVDKWKSRMSYVLLHKKVMVCNLSFCSKHSKVSTSNVETAIQRPRSREQQHQTSSSRWHHQDWKATSILQFFQRQKTAEWHLLARQQLRMS